MTRPRAESSSDPLFAVALLRIALELKKSPDASLDALTSQVAARMKLDEGVFRRFLEGNLGLLKATATRAHVPAPATTPVDVSAKAEAPARSRRTGRG